MVYAERTTGSAIVLDAPKGDEAQVEAQFGTFKDRANLDTR
jgi:hypothetical protein